MNSKQHPYLRICTWMLSLLSLGLCLFPHSALANSVPNLILERRLLDMNEHPITVSNLPALRSQVGHALDPALLQWDIDHLYLSGQFESVSANVKTRDKGIVLNFLLKPYPTLKAIDIKGNNALSNSIITALMEQKIGTPFNMKNAATDIENIEAHYLEKGYQYAKVERMKIHPNGTLVLELSEGEVQNVSWRGADEKLNTQLLNASLSIQPGSVYKAQGINRDRQQLLQSGFFSSVSMPIVQQKINPSGLDMTYVVKEKSKNSFDIGLEQLRYEDGLAIFSAYQRRHFIIYSDLFKISTQFRLGNEIAARRYSALYQQPWLLNKYNVHSTLQVWNDYRKEPLSGQSASIENIRTGGNGKLRFSVLFPELSMGLGARIERVAPFNNGEFRPYNIHSFQGQLSWDSRNDISNPDTGALFSIAAEVGGDYSWVDLGGLDFYRYMLQANRFFALGPKTVLALRGVYGVFERSQDINTFESEAFYLGGANSLRGYSDLQFNGNYRLSSSLEIRQQIRSDWIAVLFLDAGQVAENPNGLHVENFNYGYGFGVRYLTGLLPVRLDLGWGDGFHIHFNLGHTF